MTVQQRAAAVVVVLGLAVLVGVGALPKLRRREALARSEERAAAPRRVAVGRTSSGEVVAKLSLPGSVMPLETVTLYARTSGFVSRTLVDLGDKVKKGQLLAELRAPETADEIALSKARLEEAELNEAIARQRAVRRKKLLTEGLATPDEAEDFDSRANSAAAAKKTTRAELQRQRDLASYLRVTAPFDGSITRRHLTRGALVATAGTPVFDLSMTDRLRVVVDVPQSLAADVRVGTAVRLALPHDPTRTVDAKVTRSAGALDPQTRTLRVEIEIDGNGPFLAGAFADVSVSVERAKPPVLVPAAALFIRKDGPRVMVLGPGDTAVSRPVTIGRDLGRELEISAGLAPGETVVMNPPDDLADGERVDPVQPKAPPSASASR